MCLTPRQARDAMVRRAAVKLAERELGHRWVDDARRGSYADQLQRRYLAIAGIVLQAAGADDLLAVALMTEDYHTMQWEHFDQKWRLTIVSDTSQMHARRRAAITKATGAAP